MYNRFDMTISNIPAIAALFGLLISGAAADNYQPLPGSFRPPSLGGTSKAQSGFRQGNSQFITTPSQQQAWTSQPYGSSSHYYLPGQQSGPEYQQQNTPTDTWNRSFNINPGNTMNNMFGYGNNSSDNRAQYNYQQPAYQPPIQQPAYQPPIQQAPVYPQQYNYGSSYPQQYGYTAPPIQQSPTSPPRQPPQQPAPFSSRPFGGNSSHFRPPEL
jgi:hypothetical protein